MEVNIRNGYVSMPVRGIALILTYGPTKVYVRIVEATNVRDACDELSRLVAGNFHPADTDQIAWTNAVFKGAGMAEVIG